ncbi:hypothetical protein ASU31_18695 [Pedobacter ginsenosidimutans]|uniref:Uncharacterized protein n=1 Tax=Pedobacter ginsenosidimutans TaxID=687842 RepID=A0A0T5VLR3_9SPHI|nr:hypothetical protein ASU31_18695 [Pedobacter ginsenosidimutans]
MNTPKRIKDIKVLVDLCDSDSLIDVLFNDFAKSLSGFATGQGFDSLRLYWNQYQKSLKKLKGCKSLIASFFLVFSCFFDQITHIIQ